MLTDSIHPSQVPALCGYNSAIYSLQGIARVHQKNLLVSDNGRFQTDFMNC